MRVESVIPFVRSFVESRLMLGPGDRDQWNRVPGVAYDPASFSAEVTQNDLTVTPLDPLCSDVGCRIRGEFDWVDHSRSQEVPVRIEETACEFRKGSNKRVSSRHEAFE